MPQDEIRLQGNFTSAGKTDLLHYFALDGNWWLGHFVETQLTWTLVGNTSGFGNLADGRRFWVGSFTRFGQLDLLFYASGDGNWWLGHFTDNHLNWTRVCNTAGFGNLNDGRPFWIGNFSSSEQADLLFYSPSDGHWWLGRFADMQLTWTLVADTAGFGNLNDGRPFWAGNFTGSDRTELLFYTPGDGNWWLGHFVEDQLRWTLSLTNRARN
jgi:hypothetical protein